MKQYKVSMGISFQDNDDGGDTGGAENLVGETDDLGFALAMITKIRQIQRRTNGNKLWFKIYDSKEDKLWIGTEFNKEEIAMKYPDEEILHKRSFLLTLTDGGCLIRVAIKIHKERVSTDMTEYPDEERNQLLWKLLIPKHKFERHTDYNQWTVVEVIEICDVFKDEDL